MALLKLSRGLALLRGRDFVTPDDVKEVAVPALGHRLVLRPELWVQDLTGDDVVREFSKRSRCRRRSPPANDPEATGRVRSLAMVGGMSLLLALALGVPEVAAIGAGAAGPARGGSPPAGEAKWSSRSAPGRSGWSRVSRASDHGVVPPDR